MIAKVIVYSNQAILHKNWLALIREEDTREGSFDLNSCIQGYHVYKDMWTAAIGEEVSCECKLGNHEP